VTEVVNSGATEEIIVANPDTNVEVKTDTIVNSGEVKAPASWIADDWRDKLAGGDQKELDRLKRFTDINAVYKSYRELEGRVSSGALKQEVDVSKLDDTQLAAWRQANGIPASAGDYQLNLPDGLALGEEDQTILGNVLEEMHRQGRKPAEVNATVNAFLEAKQYAHAAEIENQKVARTQAEEQLRQEWHGATYLTNLAAVKNMLASAPDGIGDLITTARLQDGSIVGNNRVALKWLAGIAMELNPAGTVVPGDGGNQLQSIQAEKAELDALMSKDLNAWRKNDPARARHRELIDAELKLKARGY
jgi:hypothetical protein